MNALSGIFLGVGSALFGNAIFCAGGAEAGTLTLTVTNVEPNGTTVYAALCSGGLDRSFCTIGDRKNAVDSTVRFRFANVPAGRYAVLSYQDLNNDGSLDRSKLGLPLEPFALSNDSGRRGRPTFEQAAISVGEGTRDLTLELRRPPRAP